MTRAFPSEVKPTADRVADWVEYRALEQSVAFKLGDLRSAITIEDVDRPELLEQQVWDLLKKRAALFGSQWPLQLRGSRVTRRRPSPVDLNLYRYLLLLGLGEIEKEDRQLFELLVADVVSGITQHPGYRVGAPALAGQASAFRQRIDTYAAAARLVPILEYVAQPLPSDQDLGLDVVSWFPFSDSRSGSFHLVVQCATGEDWDDKLDELHIPTWSAHINWAVPPLRVFSLPHAVTQIPDRWLRICRRAGVVLDRPRLMELNQRKPITAHLARQVRSRIGVLSL